MATSTSNEHRMLEQTIVDELRHIAYGWPVIVCLCLQKILEDKAPHPTRMTSSFLLAFLWSKVMRNLRDEAMVDGAQNLIKNKTRILYITSMLLRDLVGMEMFV